MNERRRKMRVRRERGVALVIALFALMLISAVAFGMMYMSTTETRITANYRASEQAYFAAIAGVEEARDRIWNTAQGTGAPLGLGVALPAALPTLSNAAVIYITNPSASDGAVHPWDPNSPYYDDELCHERYPGLNMPEPGANSPCPSSSLPTVAGWYTDVPSVAPFTGTNAALAYKWVRIAVKNNKSGNPYFVDGNPASTSTSPVCWNQYDQQEDLLSKNNSPAPQFADETVASKEGWLDRFLDNTFGSAIVYADDDNGSGSTSGGGTTTPPANCETLSQSFPRQTVYTVTALASTITGARKMVQFELASNAFTTPPIPSPVALMGPTPASYYAPATVANFQVKGNDIHQGPNSGCSSPVSNKDAVTVADSTAVTNLVGALQQPSNYTGASGSTPDVAPLPSDGAAWNNIVFLSGMVSSLRTRAQISNRYFNTMTGALPATMDWGSATNPHMTFVDGNVTVPSGAGLLVVTGNLTFAPDAIWKGSVLVIGTGSFNLDSNTSSGVVGSVLVARTASMNDQGTSLTPLTSLGSPTFALSGTGPIVMQWDSCWAGIMNQASSDSYKVLSVREFMY